MYWICVRTYGNGKFMNSVYPVLFSYLSAAEAFAEDLNKQDCLSGHSDKWVAIPMYENKMAF